MKRARNKNTARGALTKNGMAEGQGFFMRLRKVQRRLFWKQPVPGSSQQYEIRMDGKYLEGTLAIWWEFWMGTNFRPLLIGSVVGFLLGSRGNWANP